MAQKYSILLWIFPADVKDVFMWKKHGKNRRWCGNGRGFTVTRQVAPVNGTRRFAQLLGRGEWGFYGFFDGDPRIQVLGFGQLNLRNDQGKRRLPLKPLQCHWALGVNIARPAVPGGHGDWRNALGQWATWAVLRWGAKQIQPFGPVDLAAEPGD